MNWQDFPPLQNADDIAAFVSAVLSDEEPSKDERGAFLAGYIAGITYALAKTQEGDVAAAAAEITARMIEVETM